MILPSSPHHSYLSSVCVSFRSCHTVCVCTALVLSPPWSLNTVIPHAHLSNICLCIISSSCETAGADWPPPEREQKQVTHFGSLSKMFHEDKWNVLILYKHCHLVFMWQNYKETSERQEKHRRIRFFSCGE